MQDAPPVDGPSEDAPFGWMVDRVTGERRPKKRPGKQAPVAPPGLADLKAGGPAPVEDRAPGPVKSSRRRRRGGAAAPVVADPEPVAPFRAGPIAKGMNRIYARAGRLIRVIDPDVGSVVIACTRKESDDDVTIGEAWEELARTNPRIRVFLLRVIGGHGWYQLVLAHGPILLAIMMKERIRKHLPFQRFVEALFEPGDDGPSEAQAATGLELGDVQGMMAMAQNLMAMQGMGSVNGGRSVPPAEDWPAE